MATARAPALLARRSLFSALRPPRRFSSSSSSSAAGGTSASDRAHIIEVGPRDGLQNENLSIPLATKRELIARLAGTGLQTIEAGAFVSPKWIPQMKDSGEVLAGLLQAPPVSSEAISYQFLVPNVKGLESFFDVYSAHSPSSSTSTANADAPPTATAPTPEIELSIFTAATDSFSLKNTNCTVSESLTRFRSLISTAQSTSPSLRIRAYISVALGCPYEGPQVAPSTVADLAISLLEMGCTQISVADTTGMGTAPRTAELLRTLAAAGVESQDLALHFHDTYGQALVNACVGLEHGVRSFDGAVAGLGGCPFSPGATGNVATEDLVHCFHSLGVDTGVDLAKVAEVGEWISGELGGRRNESRAGRATMAARARLKKGKDF